MKQKLKSKNKTLRYTVLIVFALLITTAVGLYQYNYFAVEKNGKLLMGLREDMKSLQVEFNKVQDGWEYDEYCHGVGGPYDKNDLITCTIEIKNANDIKSQENHDRYIGIIEKSGKFKIKNKKDRVTLAREFVVSNFIPISISKGECTLSDLDYIESNAVGLAYYCDVFDAKAFHFRKK